MLIPFNDLSRYKVEIPDLNGCYLNGYYTERFEKEFAAYLGCDNFVTIGNGSDALEIALRCLDAEDIVVAPNAGMYGTLAALQTGKKVHFEDVDDNLLVPRGTIVTHLYGQISEVPKDSIEDCAHTSKLVGDFGIFSFYPTKNLGAYGNGGGIACNNEIAKKVRSLKQYGWSEKYHVDTEYGRHSQMDEIQAAILLQKLPDLDKKNQRRREIRNYYRQTDFEFVGGDYIPHLCVIMVDNRDEVRMKLKQLGISTEIHYPILDYQQKIMNMNISCPNAERAVKRILSIPCFPEMTDTEVEYVADALRTL